MMQVVCEWPCPGQSGTHSFQYGECSGPLPVLVEAEFAVAA